MEQLVDTILVGIKCTAVVVVIQVVPMQSNLLICYLQVCSCNQGNGWWRGGNQPGASLDGINTFQVCQVERDLAKGALLEEEELGTVHPPLLSMHFVCPFTP